MNQEFCTILVVRRAPDVVDSIVVVGALTRCALLRNVCDLKATQINVLLCGEYYTRQEQFKPWRAPDVVDSIEVVGALTRCALLRNMCDLKATQINVLLCGEYYA